jgi:hypothetical protein
VGVVKVAAPAGAVVLAVVLAGVVAPVVEVGAKIMAVTTTARATIAPVRAKATTRERAIRIAAKVTSNTSGVRGGRGRQQLFLPPITFSLTLAAAIEYTNNHDEADTT